ncbi:MAG TPA: radical SAM protein [Bryobacteraceae bacterium]|nr:radical SAM protein [Bryobacteraceae bacterium]
MDVLLTHSNYVFSDEKQRQKMEPYPPLQTLLAAAVLRECGLAVTVCDIALECPEEKLTKAIQQAAPCLVVVCEDDFNFLTKMCLSRNRELAFWTAKLAREYGCLSAVHGSDSTDRIEEYLQAGFNYVLLGEVEDTLRELAIGAPPREISGLAYLDAITGTIHRTPARPRRTYLDKLPMPAWDLVDINLYRKQWLINHGYFSLNMVSSRGCPFHCNWCAKPIWGNTYYVRSAMNVAEEMLHLKRRYAPDHIWFADDIFAPSARWTREFADAVEQLGAQIPFKMQSRCDLMTRDTVADLKRAGCSDVWMGAESGSQRILDAMEKGTKVHQIYEARENLRRNDIRAGLFLQFGYPGETWDDIEATICMVRALRPDDVGISVTYPLPGTKLHQLVSAELGKKRNWTDSADLSMMFHGTFSTELYRALARAIHLEIRNPGNASSIANSWADVEALKPAQLRAMEVAL